MSSVTVSHGQVEYAFQQWLDSREAIFERIKIEIFADHEKEISHWNNTGWFARKFLYYEPNEKTLESKIRRDRRWFYAQYENEVREIENLLASNRNEITISERHAFIFKV